MTIFEKIKALFGKSAAKDSARDEPTRRRFLRQLVALTGGVATGLILPTRTLVTVPNYGGYVACGVSSMLDYPSEFSILGLIIYPEQLVLDPPLCKEKFRWQQAQLCGRTYLCKAQDGAR